MNINLGLQKIARNNTYFPLLTNSKKHIKGGLNSIGDKRILSAIITSTSLATIAINQSKQIENKEQNSITLPQVKNKQLETKFVKLKIRELCTGYGSVVIQKIIDNFDYENAETHLKNLKRCLASQSPNIVSWTENGYFSSIEGANNLNYIFELTKSKDKELSKSLALHIATEIPSKNISNLQNYIISTNSQSIAKTFQGIQFLISVGELTPEEFERFKSTGFRSETSYISKIPEINQLLTKFKNEKSSFLRILDEELTKLYRMTEDKAYFTDLFKKIIEDCTQNIQNFYYILTSENDLECYKKAYDYIRKNGTEKTRMIVNKSSCDISPPERLDEYNYDNCYFDSNGELIRRVFSQKIYPFIIQRTITNNEIQIFKKSLITEACSREVYSTEGDWIFSEVQECSKINPNKFNIYRIVPRISSAKIDSTNNKSKYIKYRVGSLEKTASGMIIEERCVENIDGSKNNYLYITKPNGSKYTKIIFQDTSGKTISESTYKYRIIDNNHFETIENGVKYDIVYKPDRVIVTKENGEVVTIKIGKNDEYAPEVLSQELIPILKQMPGSIYFAIDKYKLQKIGKNINNVKYDNAHYSPWKKLISLSEERSSCLFTLLHELGHYLDNFLDISYNNELKHIYKAEVEAFTHTHADIETQPNSYTISANRIRHALGEMVADLYASRFDSSSRHETRVSTAKTYFPKTFQFITEALNRELL